MKIGRSRDNCSYTDRMEVPYKFEKIEKQPKKCLKTG